MLLVKDVMVHCIKVRRCCLYYFNTLWQQFPQHEPLIPSFFNHHLACLWCSLSFEEMSSVWQQESSGYSPCVEIDSSSLRCKDRLITPAWLKQEQDDLRIIKWENFQTGASADAVQDNTPSSAMSGESKEITLMGLKQAAAAPQPAEQLFVWTLSTSSSTF